jgi:hypothetical protein
VPGQGKAVEADVGDRQALQLRRNLDGSAEPDIFDQFNVVLVDIEDIVRILSRCGDFRGDTRLGALEIGVVRLDVDSGTPQIRDIGEDDIDRPVAAAGEDGSLVRILYKRCLDIVYPEVLQLFGQVTHLPCVVIKLAADGPYVQRFLLQERRRQPRPVRVVGVLHAEFHQKPDDAKF